MNRKSLPKTGFRRSGNTMKFSIECLGERRMMAAGALDTTFGSSGRTLTAFDLGGSNQDFAYATKIDSSGRIVVVGSTQRSTSGDVDFAVARYTKAGARDTTFGNAGKAIIAFDRGGTKSDVARGIDFLSDGRIIVVGTVAASSTGDTDIGIACLTTSGKLDTSFNGTGKRVVAFDNGGTKADGAWDVAVAKATNRIIVAGYATFGTGDTDMAVVRLLSNGSLDTTFSGDGKATVAFDRGVSGRRLDQAYAVAVLSDNRVVLAGTAQNGTSTYSHNDVALARLKADGNLDTTFDGDGKRSDGWIIPGSTLANNEQVRDLAVQVDGKYVVAGFARDQNGSNDFMVLRYTTTGAVDPTFNSGKPKFAELGFNSNNRNVNDEATAVAVQGDGKIIVAGTTTTDFLTSGNHSVAVIRLTTSGALDTTFHRSTTSTRTFYDYSWSSMPDSSGNGVAIQSDGKIVVVGSGRRTTSAADYDWILYRLMNV
jgi:uncharacterized delta-60 repeat protein